MGSIPRGPRLSTAQYYKLEEYFFRLALYTDSEEYLELPTISRRKVDDEINRISVALDIMQIFRNVDKAERSVVAWKVALDHEDEFRRLLRFSTVNIASRCLGVRATKISAVCRKEPGRHSTGGYAFRYEDEYEKDAETVYDANINLIKAENSDGRDDEHVDKISTDAQPVLSDVGN